MHLEMLESLLKVPAQAPGGLVLAFDFGLRRIGCAVGQAITGTATPLKPILAQNGTPEWKTCDQRVQEWEPEVFVVGIPLHTDGSVQWITQQTLKFITQLQERYHRPIFGIDEVLTSVAAENLKTSTPDLMLKGQSTDSLSAKIMLESWFSAIACAQPNKWNDDA
jgi:putative Holliday junction resolvase